jgi:hypothetical protein
METEESANLYSTLIISVITANAAFATVVIVQNLRQLLRRSVLLTFFAAMRIWKRDSEIMARTMR